MCVCGRGRILLFENGEAKLRAKERFYSEIYNMYSAGISVRYTFLHVHGILESRGSFVQNVVNPLYIKRNLFTKLTSKNNRE